MTYFPTDLVTRYQTRADTALPSTCTVHNKTRIPDNRGGYTEGPGSALATYACRLGPGKTVTVPAGGNLEEVIRYELTLESDAVVNNKQMIKVGGATYEVVVGTGRDWMISPKITIQRST